MFTQSYRDLPPEPVPPMVRCCPDHGEEVSNVQYGEDESLEVCTAYDHLVEGQTVEVPYQVFDEGPDATIAYIEQRRVA